MNYLFRQIIIAIVVLLSVGVTSCGDGKKSEASDSQSNPQVDNTEASAVVEEITDMDIFADLEKDEMVFVKGGTFLMGAQSKDSSLPNYDPNSKQEESPVHQVTLDSYYIGKYEVTQQFWEYVMKYNGLCVDGSMINAYAGDMWFGLDTLSTKNCKGDYYPAYNVSWEDVVHVFIPRLNRITGKNFRLPTEAEWEYAARGGEKSAGYLASGGNVLDSIAWCRYNAYDVGEQSADYGSHEVGKKAPNELGIYDMSGNVCEWCSDWYGDYEPFEQTNPKGPSLGAFRIGRGGGWNYLLNYSYRVASRTLNNPTMRDNNMGFRLAWTDADMAEESIDSDVEISNSTDVDIFANLEKDAMVFVEGGSFLMGAQSYDMSLENYDEDAMSDESPVHQVTMDSYYIGKYEVTQQFWEYVMRYNGTCADGSSMSAYEEGVWLRREPEKYYGKGYYFPAYYVSDEDIVNVFIPRLNKITGKTFRLPTEAEWEYAARGGNKSQGFRYSGSDNIDDVAWYKQSWDADVREARQVGTKAPNELGIYDMTGNVEEWCSDIFSDYHSDQAKPVGLLREDFCRVFRGGSWDSYDKHSRVTKRGFRVTSIDCLRNIGFRLASSDL